MDIFPVFMEKIHNSIDNSRKMGYTVRKGGAKRMDASFDKSSICRFVPTPERPESINIINFVYETKPQHADRIRNESVYRLHLVVRGSGRLRVLGKEYELTEGDLFLLFPATPYSIESAEDFEYQYISYFGLRTNALTESLGIHRGRFLFHGLTELLPLWKNAILDDRALLRLRCEGLLLYTLSVLGEKELSEKESETPFIEDIKLYIDEHFDDPELSMEKLGQLFSYNPKYLSTVFKKNVQVGFSQYLTTLRMQKAISLMQSGYSSVRDIACRCGFADPFYFSRCFKKVYAASPKEYISLLAKSGGGEASPQCSQKYFDKAQRM